MKLGVVSLGCDKATVDSERLVGELVGQDSHEMLREEALQRTSTAHVAQTCQGFLLDLTHPLAGDTQQATDLLQSHRLLALEPEVQSQDLGFSLFEG